MNKKFKYSFKNKVILISGASRGIGYEVSKLLIKHGANLMICSSNLSNIIKSYNKLIKIKKKNQKIFYSCTDVSSEKSVKELIDYTFKKFNRLDILINNAGIYGPKGFIEKVNWDEWKEAINVNLFGSILLSRSVIGYFKKYNKGRIIQLGGGGVAGPLPRITAYGASKIGITRFAESLAQEVKKYNIHINTVAPGAINTQMLEELIKAGPKKIGAYFYKKALLQKKRGGSGYKKICDLILFLCSVESDGIKGKLLHALWDDWYSLRNHTEALSKSDIYTLKRINPVDRNLKWGIVDNEFEYDKLFSPWKNNK